MPMRMGLGAGAFKSIKPPSTGTSYDSAATALFAAMSGTPSAAQKTAYNTAILALKASGAWEKFDIAYFLMGYSDSYAADSLFNIKNPASYKAVPTDPPPTYSFADKGWKGETGAWLDVAWNVLSNSSQYTRYDNSFGVYTANSGISNYPCIGGAADASAAWGIIRSVSGNIGARNNNLTINSAANAATHVGLMTSNRTADAAHRLYMTVSDSDVGLLGSDPYTTATVGIPNSNIKICSISGSENVDNIHYLSFAWFGAAMTEAQILAIRIAVYKLNAEL